MIKDLIKHTKDAAFSDNGFNPVDQNKKKNIKVSISLLTEPKKIEFSDEVPDFLCNYIKITKKPTRFESVFLLYISLQMLFLLKQARLQAPWEVCRRTLHKARQRP